MRFDDILDLTCNSRVLSVHADSSEYDTNPQQYRKKKNMLFYTHTLKCIEVPHASYCKCEIRRNPRSHLQHTRTSSTYIQSVVNTIHIHGSIYKPTKVSTETTCPQGNTCLRRRHASRVRSILTPHSSEARACMYQRFTHAVTPNSRTPGKVSRPGN